MNIILLVSAMKTEAKEVWEDFMFVACGLTTANCTDMTVVEQDRIIVNGRDS